MRALTTASFMGALLLAAALTGCGSEEPTPAADEPIDSATEDIDADAPKEEPAAPADEPEPAAAIGVVIVDGLSYEVTETTRCEPYEDGVIERKLELQGFGEHDGARFQIDVYLETIGGAPHDNVSWAGPEGVFGMGETGEANVALDAGETSVRGVATLYDSLTFEDSVLVEFDLPVPPETFACR